MTGNSSRIILQPRDHVLLRELSLLRIADREQAKVVAGFHSTTRANTRLLALTRAGVLRRYFLGSVGGARKALYALSVRGAAIAGVPYRGPRRRQDETLAADFFTQHQLAINDLYCILKFHLIPLPEIKFLRWESFYEPVSQTIPLIPDGYTELAAGQKTLAMFVEVDLGTESRSVWQRKVQAYLSYAISGEFQARFAQSQFRILAVTNSERRLSSLREATAKITDKIFWFTTLASIAEHGFWSPIWMRPTHSQTQPQPLLQTL